MFVSKKWLTVLIIFGLVLAVTVSQAVMSRLGLNSSVNQERLKGSPESRVIVLEFTDFQCPACAKTASLLEDLVKNSKGVMAVEHIPPVWD